MKVFLLKPMTRKKRIYLFLFDFVLEVLASVISQENPIVRNSDVIG